MFYEPVLGGGLPVPPRVERGDIFHWLRRVFIRQIVQVVYGEPVDTRFDRTLNVYMRALRLRVRQLRRMGATLVERRVS